MFEAGLICFQLHFGLEPLVGGAALQGGMAYKRAAGLRLGVGGLIQRRILMPAVHSFCSLYTLFQGKPKRAAGTSSADQRT